MKKPFFKFIQIDTDIVQSFCESHPKMIKFIDYSAPFYVRVGRKLYPTLIHTIISSEGTNKEITAKLEFFSKLTKNKINPKKVSQLDTSLLNHWLGEKTTKTIQAITKDIVDKKLNLKKLAKKTEKDIYLALSIYPNITISIIKTFALFGCFKQNVLCNEEKEFIDGLKFLLDKKEITQKDLQDISVEYNGQYTLLSLCLFKIYNEKAGK